MLYSKLAGKHIFDFVSLLPQRPHPHPLSLKKREGCPHHANSTKRKTNTLNFEVAHAIFS